MINNLSISYKIIYIKYNNHFHYHFHIPLLLPSTEDSSITNQCDNHSTNMFRDGALALYPDKYGEKGRGERERERRGKAERGN